MSGVKGQAGSMKMLSMAEMAKQAEVGERTAIMV
jgi:hypothetical protein